MIFRVVVPRRGIKGPGFYGDERWAWKVIEVQQIYLEDSPDYGAGKDSTGTVSGGGVLISDGYEELAELVH